MAAEERRPDPDELLKNLKSHEQNKQGRLKIFLGYAAGVGKTYSMLDEAREQLLSGVDVLVGYVEPHTRPETLALLQGLPQLPPLTVEYKNIQLREFDLEGALQRNPRLILVDELAHTNASGLRNKKRYQDIEELLNAGIDVYTTVNVQHIESLNDIVEDITKIAVKETIPDYIFDNADKVKLVDIDPDELLRRLNEGKIYRPERAQTAMNNFFTRENLRLLREIALRKTTDRISQENLSGTDATEKKLSTRFLVCIGPSQSSSVCIRWTARTAEAFHAPWIALYVETPTSVSYSDGQKKNVRDNMELVARLGGQIVTLSGYDVATSVSEYAKLSGIENIVIGKGQRKKTIRNYFSQDIEEKLVSLLPDAEIHIIPDRESIRRRRDQKVVRWKRNFYFSWADAAKTISVLVAATLICLILQWFGIGNQNTIMVYILSVLVISRITAGYAFGITASVLSVLTFNFFFVEPYYTFTAIQPGYPVTFLIMLLVALITSAMMIRIKTQAKMAAQRERRTEVLYEINKKLLATRGLENIVDLTNDYVSKLLNRSVIFYHQDPEAGTSGVFCQSSGDSDASFLLTPDEQAVAHWVFVNKKRAGAGTDTLMGAGGFYMPIMSQGSVLAVLGISCANGVYLDHSNRIYLRMIASLVALSLQRQHLSDEQRKIIVESEKENMRSNLLRAISHDLRTPLTSILGASSAVLDDKSMDKKTRDQLIGGIREDSQWLIRMVENLLSVTRISESAANVKKQPEAAEEVVSEAVSRSRSKFPDCIISVKVPEELLLVPMDGTLIEQVIINLLENAVKHTSTRSPIELNVKKSGAYAVFEVADHGPGIPEEDLPYLFEGYFDNSRKSADSSRGMGVGLSICRSIIKAHGGQIEAENNPQGGAVFRFSLPMEGGAQYER